MSSIYMSEISQLHHSQPNPNSIVIKIGEILGNNSRLEITPWDQGISWFLRDRLDEGYVFSIWDIPQFSINFIKKTSEESGRVLTIPDDVITAIDDFEQQYDSHASAALWFVSRSIEAKELLLDCPFIFWCVLEYGKSLDLEVDEIFNIFGKKRKFILNKFDIDGTKYQIKLLKSFKFNTPVDSINVKKISCFFKIVTGHQLVRFQYLSMDIITAIINHPSIIGAKWLYKLDESVNDQIRSFISLHFDSINMLDTLMEANKSKNLYACPNVAALETFHNKLIERMNEIEFIEKEKTIFSPSPLEETETIRYISNSKQLHLEGKLQKHCVYGFQRKIVAGMYFVYQYVGTDERATIGIKRTANGLEIDQIRAKCNRPVSDAVQDEILSWLLEEKRSHTI